MSTKKHKEMLKAKRAKRATRKCTGCGNTFTRKEMDAHITDIIKSARV